MHNKKHPNPKGSVFLCGDGSRTESQKQGAHIISSYPHQRQVKMFHP